MKNFRKVAAVLLAVVFVCALALSLVACDKVGDNSEKTITIVIGEGEGQIVYADYKTTAPSLTAVIEELGSQKTDPLAINATWSVYGLYILSIGNLVPTAANQFICILTSDKNFQMEESDDFEITKKTYNGTAVCSASKGASSLALKDGEIYMFVIETF